MRSSWTEESGAGDFPWKSGVINQTNPTNHGEFEFFEFSRKGDLTTVADVIGRPWNFRPQEISFQNNWPIRKLRGPFLSLSQPRVDRRSR